MNKQFYHQVFANEIYKIKEENRYRNFNELQRNNINAPYANWIAKSKERHVIIWCSNDYLGMSQNKIIVDAAIKSLLNYGTGSGGTRNISGNHQPIVELEKEIALLHDKESSLVFSSGYVANESAISSILNLFKNITVFSDEKNHASIISGIKKASCNKVVFKHNDIVDLENKLKFLEYKDPKIIIFESIYSMDGSISDIKTIVNLAKKYNCLTYLDEVHAVGMYGETGAGMSEELGVKEDIDVIQGNLAKAYGNFGGYIASNNIICDYIRSTASGFIFTTSIPPLIAEASIKSIKYLKTSSIERDLQKSNVKYLKKQLVLKNINFLENESHIVPVMINNPLKCKQISELLLDKYGHYIQPINYPTVPRGSERLRITPGPLHTKKMIDNLVNALSECIIFYNV